ncbi:nucleotidyltransferase family protein [Tissierella carlieri]|jgi:molybdenum cofactor cytidylyltransferase|uniref:nucleotidyltransferase family protein n=1 Tax=Tissierella TaxID=41273 RepID=UPI001C1046C8|nr:nucleotidyltransferase family protein [Tissierella carlieri]MBU5313550.1 nucleotidyltransferase family protein [Tissierella carlieri]MDU5083085.1 nucleotidyltransferase family protein [Bacillota bacterium]
MNVEGIVLAAGLSSRVGINKLLLDIDGKTVIEQCILGMYDVCSRIIVIGGHKVEDIKKILSKYPKVELIYNPDYLDGMFSSVKKGIYNIKGEKFFLTPGDYPIINKKTYKDMLNIDEDIVIPVYNGKRGHPLLMKSYLVNKLLSNNSYKTLRDFISINKTAFLNVNDLGILMDIDTIEDYSEISKLYMVGD